MKRTEINKTQNARIENKQNCQQVLLKIFTPGQRKDVLNAAAFLEDLLCFVGLVFFFLRGKLGPAMTQQLS